MEVGKISMEDDGTLLKVNLKTEIRERQVKEDGNGVRCNHTCVLYVGL